jgi:hypothetical protein
MDVVAFIKPCIAPSNAFALRGTLQLTPACIVCHFSCIAPSPYDAGSLQQLSDAWRYASDDTFDKHIAEAV